MRYVFGCSVDYDTFGLSSAFGAQYVDAFHNGRADTGGYNSYDDTEI
jgi:hypothetical protein